MYNDKLSTINSLMEFLDGRPQFNTIVLSLITMIVNDVNPNGMVVAHKSNFQVSDVELAIAKGTDVSSHDGGQKILAIRLYRSRTGLGLKEAKDAVEAAMGL